MTREQKLEAALQRIDDRAHDDMLDAIVSIAGEALATPPDTNTRVVSVEMLDRWSDMCVSFGMDKTPDEIRTILERGM